MSYDWFKLHSKGWLTGSIRVQLLPEERSVWTDLLALANESRVRGVICRAQGIPYEREYIANILGIPLALLNSTIEKCTQDGNADNPDIRRIEVEADGCIRINNWNYYQAVPADKGKLPEEDARERELRERRNTRLLTDKYADEAAHKLQERGYEVKESPDTPKA